MDLLRPHHRLLAEIFGMPGPATAWVLAGGYALEAHGLLRRPHDNVDLATESTRPMPELAEALASALTARGRHEATPQDLDPLSARLAARLAVRDRETGVVLRLALHKETFWSPPVTTPCGPALSPHDAVGTKIRALYDRGLAVDLIDARAAHALFGYPSLEEAARRHARDDFDLPTLQARLEGTDHYPDSEFTQYGLVEPDIAGLRAWAQAWSTDIAERLLEEGASPDA
ncbi:nucleotidyl transferase AbiEii/AbiGii toxin family protein [Streptomyces sp. NPDC048481]|uniref:nucleotidyl transferase AbiEii/AbiGii toxin family protein n=1 Tax=Streptomyces sp. NPDC048481 TaxID=3365557 RepID=UPI00371F8755